MGGVHKTVTDTVVALLWLFLYFILLCDNMAPNKPTNRNLKART